MSEEDRGLFLLPLLWSIAPASAQLPDETQCAAPSNNCVKANSSTARVRSRAATRSAQVAKEDPQASEGSVSNSNMALIIALLGCVVAFAGSLSATRRSRKAIKS